MLLEFKDRSATKYVAEHPYGYLVVIETDFLNWGYMVNIYKDTVASLGWLHLQEIRAVRNIVEWKQRAQVAIEKIIANEKHVVWVH